MRSTWSARRAVASMSLLAVISMGVAGAPSLADESAEAETPTSIEASDAGVDFAVCAEETTVDQQTTDPATRETLAEPQPVTATEPDADTIATCTSEAEDSDESVPVVTEDAQVAAETSDEASVDSIPTTETQDASREPEVSTDESPTAVEPEPESITSSDDPTSDDEVDGAVNVEPVVASESVTVTPTPDPEPTSVAEVTHAAGWATENGERYYYDEDGTKLTGEQSIDGSWYYFDLETGAMQTGFVRQRIEAASGEGSGSFKTAYYDAQGRRLVGTQTIDGTTYYFDPQTGDLVTGFVASEDGVDLTFFSLDTGAQVTGELEVNGEWRDFGSDGTMLKGLVTSGDETYYYDTFDGTRTSGLQSVSGTWYYFDPSDGHRWSFSECAEKVISIAASFIGTPDSETWKFQEEVRDAGGNYCPDGPCLSFVWHCFRAAGLDMMLCDGLATGWPHEMFDYLSACGQISSTPQRCSIVFFYYDDNSLSAGHSATHAELVIGWGQGYIESIGAITGGIQIRTWDYSHIVGFGLPLFLCY